MSLAFEQKLPNQLEVGDSLVKIRTFEKLLSVKIDNKLSLDKHFKSIFQKANKNLTTLVRDTPYMEIGKRKLLLNAFFNVQVNYFPLIWVLPNRSSNSKISNLWLMYSEKRRSNEELLRKMDEVLSTIKIFKNLLLRC